MSQATTSCPECTGTLERDSQETVCTDCGLVVDTDRLDRGPEWRSFADDDTNRERTGAPLTRSRHDRGLSTEIGYSSRLTGRKRRQFARLRRQHNRATIPTKADRNQIYAFTEIRRLVSSLSLTYGVRDQACALFDSAQSEGLIRGRSLEGFAAAAVYVVCRTNGVARTVGEIVAVARADENELRAAYAAMNRELGLPTGPIDAREYIPRFATELDVPRAVERRATELAADASDTGATGGRKPSGVAAACLYAAAKEHDHPLTQKDAADVAGVTPVTVRNAFYDLQ
ncbi:transcription initiation factor IIB [Halarchaeum sp. P4]|uniref:transcription initiation factor IIB n=1 Tax=Halarchaeum sp. P4 TaxID=3421639 RepID=UPI003EC0C853